MPAQLGVTTCPAALHRATLNKPTVVWRVVDAAAQWDGPGSPAPVKFCEGGQKLLNCFLMCAGKHFFLCFYGFKFNGLNRTFTCKKFFSLSFNYGTE